MPKYCEDSTWFPIVLKKKSMLAAPENFMEIYKYKYEEVAIEFMQSYVKINTKLGSSDSLEFMKSLLECKNYEVYSSNLIKTILQDKWKSVCWLLIFETLLYFIYLAIICKYAVTEDDKFTLIIAFSINILLFIFEILQMISGKMLYFKSFWNYVDMTRFIIFTAYCIALYFSVHSEHHKTMLLVSVILSLIRGISYFRIFSGTRWIVKLIFDVFYEMWPLIIILTYTILSSGILYRRLTSDSEFLDALNIKDKDDFKLQWIMFLFVLILNPIIILNLYLAIVGDAFEKSQNEKAVMDGQELAEMIYEGEVMLICNRRYKNAKYLHVLREETVEIQVQNTSGQRIKKISESVSGVGKNCNQTNNDINDLKRFVEKKSKRIQRISKKILELIRN